ncbi:MAG: zinc ribbon domain-containing protein, partial [Nitrospira sp.]|nr:zinc ribbon domain-containing protein [Nitrospira sp.]
VIIMPIYEFLCETCGPFEQRRSMEESSLLMTCPACQAVAKRIFSTPGFILIPGALRHRIESSVEPKVVKRPQSEEPLPPPKLQMNGGGRPWQLDHISHAADVNPKLQRI